MSPNSLLKLTRNTDIDLLKKAIETGDAIETCGHLVSLISIKYPFHQNSMPIKLIANEIESSLAIYLSDEKICESRKYVAAGYSFLSEVIARLPVKLSGRIVFDFLLGPLARITNDNEIKANLLRYLVEDILTRRAGGYADNAIVLDGRLKRFIEIGKFCLISEWSVENYEFFRFKFINPKNFLSSNFFLSL